MFLQEAAEFLILAITFVFQFQGAVWQCAALNRAVVQVLFFCSDISMSRCRWFEEVWLCWYCSAGSLSWTESMYLQMAAIILSFFYSMGKRFCVV